MSQQVRRAATGAVLAVAVAATMAPGEPAVASRSVSQVYTVPSGGTFTVTGHGYGHGHGMSQYGAQGAARQGLGYRQILRFYYPGTSFGSAGDEIRVLITADSDNNVQVDPAKGLRVRAVSGGSSYPVPTDVGATSWRLRPASGGTAVEYHQGSWHAWRTLDGAAQFEAKVPLTLRLGSGSRIYRGALRLVNKDTVNVLPLEDYVKGVVPREMPASWLPAAVQAQAVAARTYAARDRSDHATRYYQTCDTTSCQVYGGLSSEDSRGNAAVDATAGEVLTYGGRPAFTQFGSSSGGWTSAGSVPYLPAQADPYDDFSGNPMHTWTTKLAASRIQSAWPALGKLKRIVVTQRNGNGDWYGRVEKMTLDGSRSDVTVSGNTFRFTFGLRSDWFSFGPTAGGGTSSGGSGGSATPAPAPAPAPATGSPITKRWQQLGGAKGRLGSARTRERAVSGGRVRRFAHGRIWWSPDTGAHELWGRVMRVYLRRGGTKSVLGLPETKPKRFRRGRYADFAHGTLRVYRSGKVRITLD